MGNKYISERREGLIEPIRTFLIVSEGGDECDYFNCFKKQIESGNDLIFKPLTPAEPDPKHLVEYAIDQARDLDIDEGDEVWCVFDVDNNPDKVIEKAIEEAKTQQVKTCLSNPCFDLWILLHFNDCLSKLSPQDTKAKVRIHLPNYSKKESFDKLKRRNRQKAILRAKKLNQMHKQNNVDLLSNPSTQIFHLVEHIVKTISRNRTNSLNLRKNHKIGT